jgi:RNA binding exosome subunit
MITINSRFEFERQQYCWNLYEWKDGINKKDEVVRTKTTTYHGNLMQICNEVIDRSAGDAESLQGIMEVVGTASADLLVAVLQTDTDDVDPSEYD